MIDAKIDPPVEGLLDDGTRVLFRALTSADREGLQTGLRGMSPESRYRRFFSPIDHLSETQLDYLTNIDYTDHYAWLAVLPDAPGSPGVGVARWVRDAGDPTAAEAAVAVLDAYHQRGIGSALLRLLAQSALERGVRRFLAPVLGGNEAMMALLHSYGAVSDGIQGGVIEMVVPLPETIDELDRTPAPRILRAAATGEIQPRSGPSGVGTRID
jgi:GNAT superfamily N-acetyltransferase